MHGTLANLRHERFAQALAQGKAANEAYAQAGYRANDGNASRLKGNERISARVQEIVGRAAERAEVSLERVLRELAMRRMRCGCCARAASGHVAALPSTVMNSRRHRALNARR